MDASEPMGNTSRGTTQSQMTVREFVNGKRDTMRFVGAVGLAPQETWQSQWYRVNLAHTADGAIRLGSRLAHVPGDRRIQRPARITARAAAVTVRRWRCLVDATTAEAYSNGWGECSVRRGKWRIE